MLLQPIWLEIRQNLFPEEIAGGEPGTGKQISFTLSEQEIPAGILP